MQLLHFALVEPAGVSHASNYVKAPYLILTCLSPGSSLPPIFSSNEAALDRFLSLPEVSYAQLKFATIALIPI